MATTFTPIFDFNFARSRLLPPSLTFTRASPATYIDALGRVATLVAAAPSFTFDLTTKVSKGIVLEDAGTNYVRGDITALVVGTSNPAGYAGAQPGSTVVSADLPGMQSGSLLKHQYSGAGDTNVCSQTLIGMPAGALICVSCYVLVPSGFAGTVGLTLEGNLDSNTIVVAPDLTRRNQWQRISTRGTLPAGQTSAVMVLRISGAGYIYSSCWQGEGGDVPTSFIFPGAVPTTRAATMLTMPVSGLLNPAKATIFVEFDCPNTATGFGKVFSANDGANRNCAQLVVAGGADSLYGELLTYSEQRFSGLQAGFVGGPTRAALAWASNDAELAVNGVAFATDNSVIVPPLTTLAIGSDTFGLAGTFLQGTVARIAIFGDRVPQSVLADWTQNGLPQWIGRFASADLVQGVDNWLWTNTSDRAVTTNLRACGRVVQANISIAVGAGWTPQPGDYYAARAAVVDETALVVGPGESVWVNPDQSSVSVRLHGY
jgi:hypothetical protein